MSPDDCFSKVKDLLGNDEELKKIDPNISFDFDDASKSGEAKSKQFKANVKVSQTGSGSEVEIVIDLPFHLSLAKGLVKSTLEKKLDKAFS